MAQTSLTPAQVDAYYKEYGNATNPISPSEYLTQINAKAATPASTTPSASTPTISYSSPAPTVTSNSNDAFIQQLQEKLLGQASLISSSTTNLESKIQEAITGTKAAGEASTMALESAANREIAFQKEQYSQQRTSYVEAQRGFAQNVAALNAIDERTEKSVRDLEQRKQELILQGKSETASKIADLQMKALEFRQQAEQQTFSNLMNMSQFALNIQAEERAAQQFSETLNLQKAQFQYDQQSRITEIALQYGLTVGPGETLSSIAAKAQPYASAEQKARLSQIQEKAKNEEVNMMVDSELMDYIVAGDSPSTAAIKVAAALKAIGTTVTKEEFNTMVQKATVLQEQWKTEQSKVQAEEQGKSFWGNLFGSSNTNADGESSGGFFDFIGRTVFGESPERQEYNRLQQKAYKAMVGAGPKLTPEEQTKFNDLAKEIEVAKVRGTGLFQ